MKSREARIESFSSRIVLGELIDTMEGIVEIDMGKPGRRGPIRGRVSPSTVG